MKMQTQPNMWSCLPTAFAIALDIDVKKITDYLMHDGSEIWFPDLHEPMNRRGFHTSEMFDFCWFSFGIKAMMVPAKVRLWTPDKSTHHDVYNNDDRVKKYMSHGKCVIIEPTHAVAWDGQKVYDPSRRERTPNDLKVVQVVLL